jgi:DNA-binding transcriptional LysR family regulator
MRGLLEELDALDAQVGKVAERPAGRLRLTAPLTFGTTELSPALLDFAAAYPGIELDVSFSDRVVSLVDEGFDAAVRIGRPADSSLIARRLATVRMILVASEAYLARAGTPGAPAELTEHHCIIDTNLRDPLVWRFAGGDGAPEAVGVRGRLRFSDATTCLAAAEAGLGIAHVPSFVAARSLRAGRVRPLMREREDEPFAVFVLYPPGRYLAAKVRVLVDFLAERFRQAPDWERGW